MDQDGLRVEHIDLIPLSRAVLCASCDCVSLPRRDGRCAGCGSESVLQLARLVNRQEAA